MTSKQLKSYYFAMKKCIYDPCDANYKTNSGRVWT